eukprot:4977014-Prymnesium_polylepis.1
MGRKRSSRAPPPSTPSNSENMPLGWPMPKYHHHRCHLTNVTPPQELRTIKVSLKSQPLVCVCPRRPGERHHHALLSTVPQTARVCPGRARF